MAHTEDISSSNLFTDSRYFLIVECGICQTSVKMVLHTFTPGLQGNIPIVLTCLNYTNISGQLSIAFLCDWKPCSPYFAPSLAPPGPDISQIRTQVNFDKPQMLSSDQKFRQQLWDKRSRYWCCIWRYRPGTAELLGFSEQLQWEKHERSTNPCLWGTVPVADRVQHHTTHQMPLVIDKGLWIFPYIARAMSRLVSG